jgi:hypothetical protein
MLLRITTAIALATALSGCAHANEPYVGPGLLSALPDHAPPGECYARVKIPGQVHQAPPQLQGAQWVAMPGPPGSPGPIWCLVPTSTTAVAWQEPDRYGFVRVLCETDITSDRVIGIQRQLHSRGYYRGGFSGQYDAATAAAVAQFQSQASIGHGGYLSFETVRALDSGVGAPAPYYGGYAPQPVYGGGYASAYASAPAYGGGYTSYQAGPVNPCLNPCAAVALPPPPPPVYYPQPCAPCVPPPPMPCPQPCGASYGPAYGGGVAYGYPGYGAYQSYAAAYHSAAGGYRPPMPAYAAAQAQARAGGAYASARSSVLTWGYGGSRLQGGVGYGW